MTKDEIKLQLDELGVEYDDSALKADLEELLSDALEAETEPVVEQMVEQVQEASNGYIMAKNVSHNGVKYRKGEKVELSGDILKHFLACNFVE